MYLLCSQVGVLDRRITPACRPISKTERSALGRSDLLAALFPSTFTLSWTRSVAGPYAFWTVGSRNQRFRLEVSNGVWT